MKKIIYIVLFILLLALIGFGIFYFFGNGKSTLTNFFEDTTFGTFFDTEEPSQNNTNTPPDNNPPNTQPTSQEYIPPILRQISFEPISGYTFYTTSTKSNQTPSIPSTSTTSSTTKELSEVKQKFATSTVIRFQERATGHIYDVFEFVEASQKVSNFTIQKIYSTLFSTNKDSFVYKTLSFDNEQIQTNFGKLIFDTSTNTKLDKSQISGTINDFVLNTNTNKLIYSVKQNNNSSVFISNTDRTEEKLIATLSFNEFLIDVINKDEVLITTKASKEAVGYAYTLNLKTGSLDKILGNISGLLVKVSPDKKYYIYSQSEYSKPSVRLYNTETKTASVITIDTLPSEKCIFSQSNNTVAYCFGSLVYKTGAYPDDWYKGKITNNEALFKIDLIDGFTQIIYSFGEDKVSFDVVNLKLTNKDKFILFENKNDLTLWSIDLERLSRI